MSGGGSRPFYVRALRLRHVSPGPLASFALFEGSLAVAVLLALAELVSWWAVAALPLAVATVVKLNDVVAGALRESTNGYQGARRSGADRSAPRSTPKSAPRRPAAQAVPPAPAIGRARPAQNDVPPIGFSPPARGPVFRATASVGGAVPWPASEEVDAPVSPGMPLVRRSDWPLVPRDGPADDQPRLPERRGRGNQGRFER